MKNPMQKMLRALLITFLCVSVLPIAGCWNRRELNDVLLSLAAGLDKRGDKIEVSLQMIIPRLTGGGGAQARGGSGGGSEKVFTVRSATGVTVADAIARLQEKIPRTIFWGHMKVLIIGEELAKQGLRGELDFLTSHPQVRLRTYMFVCKGRAFEILDVVAPLERLSAEQIRELNEFQIGMKVSISDFTQMMKGNAAALPWIEEVPPKAGERKDKTTIRLNGTAVFDKQGKMVGRINDEVTRGVLWLRNEIRRATVTIEPKETEGRVSLEIIAANTQLIPSIENEKWRITVKTVTKDHVVENRTKLPLMDPFVIKKLEKEAEKDLEYRIRMAVEETKRMRTDIIGFAEAFHHKYPRQWVSVKDRWDEVFPNVEVAYEPKVCICSPGMSPTPPFAEQNEVKKKKQELKQEEEQSK
ncbi:Ger(x)C family spore germination protein [Effusibacillus pohliae]|uniref:Ger(x)C family spore germination protein n=1 Tax=Effusibacillus pohliae TaxID=232270 RepID=UPI0003632F58|nr:Ger(x)C family spore germination protein [Effusibacillus pohliae]